jgi:hypothetical protein
LPHHSQQASPYWHFFEQKIALLLVDGNDAEQVLHVFSFGRPLGDLRGTPAFFSWW